MAVISPGYIENGYKFVGGDPGDPNAWTPANDGFNSFAGLGVATPTSASKQNRGLMGDVGTALKAGVQEIPSFVTGLLDIPVAAVTGRPMVSEGYDQLGQLTGFTPEQWAADTRRNYSPDTQAAQAEVNQYRLMDDPAGLIGAYARNPRAAVVGITESLPSVAAGGMAARGVRAVAPGLSPYTAAGIGEGSVMAGSHMDQSIEAGVDPRRAALAATSVGALGGVIGVAGGQVANRLGLGDIDVMLAGGARNATTNPLNLVGRVGVGAVQEGIFEEAPQSMVERAASNWAEGNPLGQGVLTAGAEGAVLGGLMGGAVNVRPQINQRDVIARREEANLLETPQRLQNFTETYTAQAGDPWVHPRAGDAEIVAGSVNPGMGLQPVDFINQQLGIGAPRQSQKDVSAAFREKLEVPQTVLDATGQPYVTDSAADWYEFQNFGKTSRNAPRAAKAVQQNQEVTTPVQTQSEDVVAPAPQITLETAKSRKDIKFWLNTQLQLGAITEEQHIDAVNQIDQGSVRLPKVKEAVGRIVNPITQERVDAELTQITPQLEKLIGKPTMQAMELVYNQGKDLAEAGKLFASEAKPEGISKEAVRKRLKTAKKKIVKHLTQSFGITKEEAVGFLTPYFTQQRATATADVNNLGLSPALQQSYVDTSELFGSENGAEQNMGVIDSVGGSQSAVGQNTLPPGYVESVAPSDVAAQAAAAERLKMKQELLTHPESRNALADWDREDVTLNDLPEQAMVDYMWDYIEAVTQAEQYDIDDNTLLEQINRIQAAVADGVRKGNYGPQQSAGRLGQSQSGSQEAIAGPASDLPADRQDVPVETQADAASTDGGKKPAQTGTTDEDVINADNDGVRYSFIGKTAKTFDKLPKIEFSDGNTRAELDASQAELNVDDTRTNNTQQKDYPQERMYVRLNFPALYAAYPALKDLPVTIKLLPRWLPESSNSGVLTKTIGGKYAIEVRAKSTEAALSNLLHEIQHWIQSAEGWQNGGTDAGVTQGSFEAYRNLFGEREARLVQERMRMTADERLSNPARLSVAPKNDGTSPEAIKDAVKSIFAGRVGSRVVVYQNADQAVAAGKLNSKEANGVQAWVEGNRVFFIADNIPAGNELAVALHEIGAHIGLENMLTDNEYQNLVSKIFDWAQRTDNSLEARIARAAIARVDAAVTNDADYAPETIAYFIEEAVNAGITPTALNYKSELGRWMTKLMNAFKTALHKLGFRTDRLTAQDVVNLAYGAAHIELKENSNETGTVRPEQTAEDNERAVGGQVRPDWREATVAKNATGQPTTIFRGTKKGFATSVDSWSTDHIGKSTGNASAYLGVWFTTKREDAQIYGDTVEEFHLDIRNPKVYNVNSWRCPDTKQEAEAMLKRLKAQGFDSIALDYRSVGGPIQYVSFDAIQAIPKPRKQFSKAADVVNNMAPAAYDTWVDFKDKLSKLNPKLLSNYQLVDQFGNDLQSLKTHADLTDKMTMAQQRLVTQSHELLGRWGEFARTHTAEDARLRKLMLDATLAGIHPDEAFQTEGNNHLTDMDRVKHEELSRRYDALPAAAKAIYQDAKNMLANNWETRKAAYANLVKETYKPMLDATSDPKELAKLQKKIDDEIKNHADKVKQLKGPYFPLLRFGDIVIVGESKELTELRKQFDASEGDGRKEIAAQLAKMEADGKHYQVVATDSASEAERIATQLTGKGMSITKSRGEKYQSELRPATFGQLEMLDDLLQTTVGSTDAKKFQSAMRDAYLAALPEHSALQRQIRRKNVQGATDDMLRAFAEVMERDSFYLSRMQYMDKIAANMKDMYRESRGDTKLGDVYNNVRDRMGMDFSYTSTPWLSKLTRISSIYHLGVAPSYLLTNMTQPFMITIPQLAGRYTAGKASRAVATAWADATKAIKGGRDGKVFSLKDADLSKSFRGGELEMIRNLMDLGKLDIANNMDTEVYASGTSPKMIKFWRMFNWASHNIELTNRLTTALAAYRLEMERSSDTKLANQKAREAIELTQLDYSDTNAAYFMKAGHFGGLNRIPMQFRKYQQGMLYLLARNLKDAWGGDKEAKDAFLYLMGTQLFMTGVRGIPVIAPLMFLAGLAGDDDDERGSTEVRMRNALADAVGADAARVFWKGLPAMMGVDSASLSMQNLMLPMPMLRAEDVTNAATGQEAAETLLFNAAGAPVGLLGRFLNGYTYMRDGDFDKGIEQLLPKFLNSPLKAARIASEGVTSRRGNVAVEAEEVSTWDTALKAAGFNPTVESEYYEALTAKESVSRAIRDRRNAVIREWASARLNGESTADLQQLVNEFNHDHPSQRITMANLIQSATQRRKAKTERDGSGVQFRRGEESLRGITEFAN